MTNDKNISDAERHRQIKEYLWEKWVDSERYGDFVIELSEDDLYGAKDIGIRRYENNRAAKKKSPTFNKNKKPTDYSRDILGACGEMAAIKWLRSQGYEADMSKFINVDNKGGETDDFDTDIVFEGQKFSVEVKTTEKPINSKLIYPLHKGKKEVQPDIFLLVCQIDYNRHVIKGFTTAESVLQNIDQDLPTAAYAIHEKELSSNLDDIIKDILEQRKNNARNN